MLVIQKVLFVGEAQRIVCAIREAKANNTAYYYELIAVGHLYPFQSDLIAVAGVVALGGALLAGSLALLRVLGLADSRKDEVYKARVKIHCDRKNGHTQPKLFSYLNKPQGEKRLTSE